MVEGELRQDEDRRKGDEKENDHDFEEGKAGALMTHSPHYQPSSCDLGTVDPVKLDCDS